MTHLHTAIVYYLRFVDTAVVAQLGGDKIYPGKAPSIVQMPYITYLQVGSTHVHHMGGTSQLRQSRMQFDCWGFTSPQAHNIANRLREALDAYIGAMGSPSAPLWISASHLESQFDEFVEADYGSETGAYRVSQDYMIWHDESAITHGTT